MRSHTHPFGVRRTQPDPTHPGEAAHASASAGSSARGRLRRGATALALTGALALTLAACGESDPHDAPSAAQTASNGDVFNDADVTFASDMVQHHAQALAMVALADGRPLDPDVQKLADQIRDAQAPEIETMTGWLNDWGQEVPATVNDHVHGEHNDSEMGDDHSGMGDMDMSGTGGDMPGMMSPEQMDHLKHASDAEFQNMWLQMMVEHHRGAVQQAQDEIDNGTFHDAVTMAKNIVSSQQAEIDQMEGMLG